MASSPSSPSSSMPSFGFSTTALEVAELYKSNIKNQVFVVTGAYSGVGWEASKALLKAGGTVVLTGRSESSLKAAVDSLLANENDDDEDKGYDAFNIDGGCPVDLADLASVQKFATYVRAKYDKIVLICNAGVMACPVSVTKQGHELQFGVNVIGHFLLAKLLVDITSRQVWVSSTGHKMLGAPRINLDAAKNFALDNPKAYDKWLAYQQSKLGNILLAREFHKRYNKSLEAAALHPGVILTNLARHQDWTDYVAFFAKRLWWSIQAEGRIQFFKTPEQGGATTVFVAASPDLADGEYYYRNCQVDVPHESATNDDDAQALFDYCDKVTQKYQ